MRNYVRLCAMKNQQIVLHDMIEKRYALRPYGWPDDEVLLLVARLLVLGEISLMMDGALSPLDKVYEAITTPAKRRKITSSSGRRPTPRRSRTPAAWARTCSPRWGRTARTRLFAFLQSKLKGWQASLTGYKHSGRHRQLPRQGRDRRRPARSSRSCWLQRAATSSSSSSTP